MLSEKEIAEIESALFETGISNVDLVKKTLALLATVKEQRELLRKAKFYTRHIPTCVQPLSSFSESSIKCNCGLTELQKQIEEAGK